MLKKFVAPPILALLVSIYLNCHVVESSLYVGHLGSNVRSDHVTECVSKFLLCSDNQSTEGLMKTNRNCYRDFQSCSGSSIEIAEVPNVSDSTEINCKYARKLNYPSSNDCRSYYQCVNSYGPPTKQTCQDNLQFNPVLQRCDRPENVVNIRPECSTSIWLTQETLQFSNAQEPRVLVVPPEAIGLSGRRGRSLDLVRNEKGIHRMTSSQNITLQTIFDVLFNGKSSLTSNGDCKQDIILGCLRNVILVCCCECPSDRTTTTTTISTTTTTTTSTTTTITPSCPEVDCEWGPWGDPGCPEPTCDPTTKTLTRSIEQQAACDGIECVPEESSKDESCPVLPTVDCKWGRWVDPGCPEATCDSTTKTLTRSIEQQGQCDGIECVPEESSKDESCPVLANVDCKWGRWVDPGCPEATCDSTTKTLTRSIDRQGQCDGLECVPEESSKDESCPVLPNVDCEWGEWNDPGCPVTCDPNATKTLTRSIKREAKCNGKKCAGKPTEAVTCELPPITNCSWGPWKATGPKCPEKCGINATRPWERSIEVMASFCGAPCTGESKKNEICLYQPCDCIMGPWSEWSECIFNGKKTTCDGLRKRTRTILQQATPGGKVCETVIEEELCKKPPVDCVWGPWLETTCSKTCKEAGSSDGVKDKFRSISQNAKCGGRKCVGPSTDKSSCEVPPCPTTTTTTTTTTTPTTTTTSTTTTTEPPTPYACILYDDQNGDGQEGQKGMIGETNLYDIENNFKFDVESVWIRENCRIEVYTGKNLDGDKKVYSAPKDDNITITFNDLNFHDNVNSAFCTCRGQKATTTPSPPTTSYPPPPEDECFCPCDCDIDHIAFKEHPDQHRILPVEHHNKLSKRYFEDSSSSFEGSGSSSENFRFYQRSLKQSKSTKSIKDNITEVNRNLYPNSSTTTSTEINSNNFDKDGNMCYCHCKCCNKQKEQTIIERLCVHLWKCLFQFLAIESGQQVSIIAGTEDTLRQSRKLQQEPAQCCPILRLSSTNDETNEFWDTKLGSYNYHSLDNNGSAVYKHVSEKDTYLFRSTTGNWMVGPEVGKNDGWMQHTKCEGQCAEMCASGWAYSNGNVWKTDESMKPTCGCSPGARVASPYDNCNTCTCRDDGTIGGCTTNLCSNDDLGLSNNILTGDTNRESTASKTSSLLQGLQGLFEIYSNSLSTPKQQQKTKILDTLEEKEKLNTGTKLVHHHVRYTNTED